MKTITFKKEYIVQARNTGKFLMKIKLDDELLTGNFIVNCEVYLSEKKLDIKKYDKFKITIEKIE